ncbi:hypothetical protein P691DRAFT_581108 [Macrolepiota fuliginosa MF-IS2]|uniref:Uncharacterized protein n=1 Tax=Macrolepiota fuliginosa MF-IS2 TaxID=1400762 RepID=A0A9P5XNJ1_9AGAR|nr:hypothetical protein P691DRAFT_581108 [Macrolepiota fuliginosa MF-IS2]
MHIKPGFVLLASLASAGTISALPVDGAAQLAGREAVEFDARDVDVHMDQHVARELYEELDARDIFDELETREFDDEVLPVARSMEERRLGGGGRPTAPRPPSNPGKPSSRPGIEFVRFPKKKKSLRRLY